MCVPVCVFELFLDSSLFFIHLPNKRVVVVEYRYTNVTYETDRQTDERRSYDVNSRT